MSLKNHWSKNDHHTNDDSKMIHRFSNESSKFINLISRKIKKRFSKLLPNLVSIFETCLLLLLLFFSCVQSILGLFVEISCPCQLSTCLISYCVVWWSPNNDPRISICFCKRLCIPSIIFWKIFNYLVSNWGSR